MKSDFRNSIDIIPGHPLFLYGNFKRTFGAFCDFVFDKLKNAEPHFCSVNDATKVVNEQCDLFDSRVVCLCIQNVEDNHLAKLEPLLYDPRYLFIMNSGDFIKSKKATQYFIGDPKSIALPSFKNELTLQSFCRLMLPGLDKQSYSDIISLINNTDEDFSSLFKKLQLLLIDSTNLLKEYVTYKRSYLDDLQPIGLIRYFLQVVIREKYSAKSSEATDTSITDLIDCEIRIKLGEDLARSLIKAYGNKLRPC